MTVRRRALLGGCITVGVAAVAGCVSDSLDAEETIRREYDGPGISTVAVETTNGTIDIRDEPRETISVEARKSATDEDNLDNITLEADQSGNRLSLSADIDIDDGLLSFGSSGRMDLTVVVPEELTIEAESTNGDITVEMTAPAEVTTSTTNGDITLLLDTLTTVTVETTNGEVQIELPATAQPAIDFETTNGSIAVSGFGASSVDAEGSTETTIGEGTHRIDVDTTNGDLTIRGLSA